MTTGISSGTATVTVSGTTSDLELTIVSGVRTTTGTTTLGTVGAGKAWKVYFAALNVESAGSASDGTCALNMKTITVLKGSARTVISGASYGVQYVNTSSVMNLSGKYILLTAGQTVELTNSSDSIDSTATIGYIEVTV